MFMARKKIKRGLLFKKICEKKKKKKKRKEKRDFLFAYAQGAEC